MSKLNEDGLVVGQSVDFKTLMRIKRKGVEDAEQKPKAKRKPKPKPSATE